MSRRRLLTFAPAFSFCLVVSSVCLRDVIVVVIVVIIDITTICLLIFLWLIFSNTSILTNSKEFKYFLHSYFYFYQHYLTTRVVKNIREKCLNTDVKMMMTKRKKY